MHHDGHTTLIEDPTTLTAAAPSAVGGLLRATRMRHGLSLNDVSAALRIRRDYLDAIEHGRSEALPAPAYAIGFVRSYAAALGLDQEEVARRYRAETGLAAKRKPELTFPAPVPERGVPAGALVAVGAVLAAALYGGWYYLTDTGQRLADVVPALPERLARIETMIAPEPAPAAPPPVEAARPAPAVPSPPPAASAPPGETPLAALPPAPAVTLPPAGAWPTGPAVTPQSLPSPRRADPSAANAAPVAGAAADAEPPAPTADSAPPASEPPAREPAATYGAAGAEAGRVLLRARADTWIQVRERNGGSVLFNRVLRPGETYRVPDRAGLVMTTGNAGGLEVLVEGETLPSLGGQGVVRRDLPLEPAALRQAVAALPR
ncbi:helix-turn-helix domain-containing protein [Elioraea sp.]|uniref:helix-turn-helix domain-containing protein n=1 Tax=Elioraea sp. TaxID=2185103 RepID=UPI00307F9468